MRGTLRLPKLFGVDVFVHWSLWVLLLIIGVLSYGASRDLDALLASGISVAILFGCVLLHELGHALAARQFGIGTRDITLLPIGGLARLERLPSDPKQELLIALAGPAVNVVLLVITIAAGVTALGIDSLVASSSFFAKTLRTLIMVNAGMAVFNLLPIFPMDGGRVLRAVLSMLLSQVTATRIAAGCGQVLAIGLGLFGVLVLRNPVLLLVAGYLIVAARREQRTVEAMHETADLQARHAMAPKYVRVSPFETVAKGVRLLYVSEQRLLPIAKDGDYFGALTVEQITDTYNAGMTQVPTIEVVDENVPVVAPSESLESVCQTLRDTGFHTLPVVQGNWLVGVISRDSIAETVRLRKSRVGDTAVEQSLARKDTRNAATS